MLNRRSPRSSAATSSPITDEAAPLPLETSRKKKTAKDTVLLVGPPGGGKTALLHRLMRGAAVETVTSMKETVMRMPLASTGASGPTITVVDVPGAPQLRTVLMSYLEGASCVVLVVNAGAVHDVSPTGHFRLAAEQLYDLFTHVGFVTAGTPVLIACSSPRSGSGKCRSPEEVKALLEAELERLKLSRPSVAAVGDDGDNTLLLGSQDSKFKFDADAPGPVSFCSYALPASTSGEGDSAAALADIEAFILDYAGKKK